MAIVDPLYTTYEGVDKARGNNWLYLDTQIVNYLRKGEAVNYILLKKIINSRQFRLCYSSAHLADYLRDKTEHKNDDLKFMSEIGMINWLSYDEKERRCSILTRLPIDIFHNGRISNEQNQQLYNEFRKPQLDNQLLQVYDWFKIRLIEFEQDAASVDKWEGNEGETFLELYSQVNLSSSQLTPEKFIENADNFWRDYIHTLSDKEASKFFFNKAKINGDELHYELIKFDLSKPNLIPQITGTKFEDKCKKFVIKLAQSMDKYDELYLFRMLYLMFQAFGVEPDKAKKFNIRSSKNDAGHCYFASMCNYLITEDDGLYRRSKVLYEVLGVTTKVFKISEFVDHFDSNYKP